MDPYKVLGVSATATEQEIKRAYRAMASKYHPDHGGDAWVFEQIRIAYEQLIKDPSVRNQPPKANDEFRPTASAGRKDTYPAGSRPSVETVETSNSQSKGSSRHFLLRQLPLQTETAWFILMNVLDLVLTNILLQRNAIESNPIANFVFIHFGFVGMIVFKLASVLFVCLAAQLIAMRSLSKAKWLLWFGCLVVGSVLVYSSRLIVSMN